MATELAKAYVQIIPSAKGISKRIGEDMLPGLGGVGSQAGQTLGSSLVSKLKTVIAAAGIGKLLGDTIMEGADLQQSIGGIETLFKDSYAQVEKYANEAYKTAGVSANDYMQQVTSFSASLLQSLGGDTAKAAEAANQALIDMSDNANKMGTDMESIQWAYQGFAKQNYTMLDNLKLGYGGTKAEMERLLADAQKLTGVKYDISNLSDVYEAIHVIQEDLGITGTTAKEAEETFTGSFNAMKGALSNFLATLALGDKGTMNIKTAMANLISSAITFLVKNAFPMIINIMSQLPAAIFAALNMFTLEEVSNFVTNLFTWITTLVTEKLPQMALTGISIMDSFVNGFIMSLPNMINAVTQFITTIITGITAKLPQILQEGVEVAITFIQGIISNIPNLMSAASDMINTLLDNFMQALPHILEAGVNIVVSLVQGIISNLPEIASSAVDLITTAVSTILDGLPKFLAAGAKLIGELAVGIVKAVPSLIAKIPGIIVDIVQGFSKIFDKMFDVGKNLVKGLWNGIKSVKDWVINKIKGFGDSILQGIKDFFGINSPSKVMDKEVGIFMAQGVGTGFVGEMNRVKKEMENSIPRKFSVAPTLGYNYKVSGIGRTRYNPWDESRAVSRAQSNSAESKKYVIEIPINLDGKTLARETVIYTDNELAKREKLISRGVMA